MALSWANEGSPEIYVSKVVFLFTQRQAGPGVSTAPVHPPDCFMIDPNRLMNHSAGRYGYSSSQISHQMTGTCSVFESLLNCIEQFFFHSYRHIVLIFRFIFLFRVYTTTCLHASIFKKNTFFSPYCLPEYIFINPL